MILYIEHNKFGTQVASRDAKRLKTKDLWKLGNMRKMSNMGEDAT